MAGGQVPAPCQDWGLTAFGPLAGLCFAAGCFPGTRGVGAKAAIQPRTGARSSCGDACLKSQCFLSSEVVQVLGVALGQGAAGLGQWDCSAFLGSAPSPKARVGPGHRLCVGLGLRPWQVPPSSPWVSAPGHKPVLLWAFLPFKLLGLPSASWGTRIPDSSQVWKCF